MVMTLEEATKEQIEVLDQSVERYIVELMDDVVDNTVFNSGLLKNNTNVSFNTEDLSVKRSADTSGGGAKADARAQAKNYKIGDDIIITNGLDYAVIVEVGGQGRSPNAYVGRAVEQFDAQMKRAVAKVKV